MLPPFSLSSLECTITTVFFAPDAIQAQQHVKPSSAWEIRSSSPTSSDTATNPEGNLEHAVCRYRPRSRRRHGCRSRRRSRETHREPQGATRETAGGSARSITPFFFGFRPDRRWLPLEHHIPAVQRLTVPRLQPRTLSPACYRRPPLSCALFPPSRRRRNPTLVSAPAPENLLSQSKRKRQRGRVQYIRYTP